MPDIVIVGAGPAGLAAAYEATRHGASAVVLERLDRVGGLARTIVHDGCLVDVGPHRFFTKNAEVQQLFVDVVAEDLVRVPRLTRVLYGRTFLNYPLTPVNAMLGVGGAEALSMIASYGVARARQRLRPRVADSFEDWTVQQFGRRLFEVFFKTYTEKVWGIPCTEIAADWAAQRIKGLKLSTAVANALFNTGAKTVKTLAGEFLFPRLGAGQFYDKLVGAVAPRGGQVVTGVRVTDVHRRGVHVERVVAVDEAGVTRDYAGTYFMSSAPITALLEMMQPPPPADVLAAARGLRYRDHIGVDLKVQGPTFPDNWIYVHSRDVQMARITNYRNFSPAMAEGSASPLTVEYFTFKDDATWRRPDDELIALAIAELGRTGITRPAEVVSGLVVRNEHAYPVIEKGYEARIAVVKAWLDRFDNLAMIGRSGMFKYNNQDHAIATGLLAARTALGLGRYDPWLVNIDAEYHEAAPAADSRRRE